MDAIFNSEPRKIMHLNTQSNSGKSVFRDTFVFNEEGNKLLDKVISKYVQMGYEFHFYGRKNIRWCQKISRREMVASE